MEEKVRTIEQKYVRSLTDLPAARKIIASRWVYQLENRYKGFREEKGSTRGKGIFSEARDKFWRVQCLCHQVYNSLIGAGARGTAQNDDVTSGRQVGVPKSGPLRGSLHPTAKRISRYQQRE